MKKKVPLVKGARRDTPERVRDLDFEARVTMADLSESIHDGLMTMVASAGLMHELLEAEITERIGPKHARIPAGERVGHRHGSTERPVVLGDRKLSVVRPRARSVGGHEIELDTWDLFSSEDLFSELVVEGMLAGVATRHHGDIAASLGERCDANTTGTSKSAISRQFVKATETALAELMARDLSEADVCILMVDVLVLAGQSCVIALGDHRRHQDPRRHLAR